MSTSPRTSSPRTSPRQSAPNDESQGIKIGVRYAETGDSQVLYFSETSTVEELKRQVMEYAEHGISCKMSSMILLQDDGSSLVKTSVPLNSLPQGITVFMFARETLLKTFTPSVVLDDLNDIEQIDDADFRKELFERCLSRCRVQIQSGTVALRNLLEHSKSVSNSFERFTTHTYQPYLERSQVLQTFDADLDKLDSVSLARNTMAPISQQKKKTMLDALPKDKIRKWADEATRQDVLIQQKYTELVQLAKSIDDGCQSVNEEWNSQYCKINDEKADAIEQGLDKDEDVMETKTALLALKQSTTKALFSFVLRQVSSLQSKIQDLSNKVAALKEGIIVQDQKLAQIATIRGLPNAYTQALKEAERRRRYALDFSSKVSQLTDFVAKERDRELERREQFHRQYGKVLPVEFVPGLTPWVFPVCEVTQRPIDPVLFANVLEMESQLEGEQEEETKQSAQDDSSKGGELLFEPEDIQGDHELSAMEVLELQAENEYLKSAHNDDDKTNRGGAFFEKLKRTHEQEVEMLKRRIEELEQHIQKKPSSSQDQVVEDASVIEQEDLSLAVADTPVPPQEESDKREEGEVQAATTVKLGQEDVQVEVQVETVNVQQEQEEELVQIGEEPSSSSSIVDEQEQATATTEKEEECPSSSILEQEQASMGEKDEGEDVE